MMNATIAVSGMNASAASLTATASNIANQMSNGPVPATPPNAPLPAASSNTANAGDSVYQAVDTVDIGNGHNGGVQTTYRPKLPSYQMAYQPDSSDANSQGWVATPNVDPVQESVNQIMDLRSFQWNAISLKTGAEMAQKAIDLLA